MVQSTNGTGMDSELAQRNQGPSNLQTHANAYQEGTYFLFNRRIPDFTSPRCGCGARRQTVAHILIHCSKYRDLRNRVFSSLSGQDNLRTILSTPQLATKAIEYVEQTQILGQNGDRRRVDDSRALGGD
jgi:hypothetical protein